MNRDKNKVNSLIQVEDYQKVINFMVKSGNQLVEKTGKIVDIGITKQFLTEEDLKIERGLTRIIKSYGDKHIIFAEEEHSVFESASDLWVVDPISGTESFIKGEGRYSIVVTHTHRGVSQFAAVYNPTTKELFTAGLGHGALRNGQQLKIVASDSSKPKVLLRVSRLWQKPEIVNKAYQLLEEYDVVQFDYSESMALGYCAVARNLYDGVVSFTKDCFPEFAGGLIIKEAGGVFTNLQGHMNLQATDRVFVGGNKRIQPQLLNIIRKAVR